MTGRETLITTITVAALCLAAVIAVGVPAAAQSSPVVTFEADSTTVDGETTVHLVATDVPDTGSVGAYEVSLNYDASLVETSVGGTDRFTVQTATDGSTTTIVGYTGAVSGPGGTVTLATLTLSPIGSGDTTLSVGSVSTFTDVSSESLAGSAGSGVSLSVSDGTSDSSNDGSGSVGGSGGGSVGGSGSESVSVTTATSTPATSTQTPTTTATQTQTSTQTSTSTQTATSTQTPTDSAEPGTETRTEDTSPTTTPTGPGFTAAATLVAIAAAVLLARRR